MVFYGDLGSKWNRYRDISRQSLKSHNVKEEEEEIQHQQEKEQSRGISRATYATRRGK